MTVDQKVIVYRHLLSISKYFSSNERRQRYWADKRLASIMVLGEQELVDKIAFFPEEKRKLKSLYGW